MREYNRNIAEGEDYNPRLLQVNLTPASRRAYQMAKVNDPEIAANSDKVVCVAARQLFNHKVNYRIEEKQ